MGQHLPHVDRRRRLLGPPLEFFGRRGILLVLVVVHPEVVVSLPARRRGRHGLAVEVERLLVPAQRLQQPSGGAVRLDEPGLHADDQSIDGDPLLVSALVPVPVGAVPQPVHDVVEDRVHLCRRLRRGRRAARSRRPRGGRSQRAAGGREQRRRAGGQTESPDTHHASCSLSGAAAPAVPERVHLSGVLVSHATAFEA